MIEDELGLFEREVGGVQFWRLVRWETCRGLSQEIDRPTGSAGHPTHPVADRIRREIAALRKRTLTPSRRSPGPVDTVLVPFPRKQVQNGVAIDLISKPALTEAGFGKILVLERTDAELDTSPSESVFVGHRDRGRQEALGRAILSFPGLMPLLAPVHRALDDACLQRLGRRFPVSLGSLALRTALFAESRKVFRRMLKATHAKRYIAAWHDQAMFAAAHDNGMETIELQHAAFSIYNPHYHFPKGGTAPYFANNFLVFAPYWTECVTLPANTRPSVLGSENMARLRAKAIARSPRRVTIPSQGPTYWRLFESVLEAAAGAPGWEFIFRPHPREDFGAYQTRLAALDVPANFRLSGPGEDVYGLISTSEVQIGLASTALFEGMGLGCRTIVFDSPISASMAGVVASGDAIGALNASDIISGLETAPAPSDPSRYYAAPVPILEALGA